MGAAAAKMTGLGQMRDDIDKMKKAVKMLQDITKQIEEKGKVITEGIDNAKKSKEQIEQQVGGITGKIDNVKSMSEGVTGNLQNVQSLMSKFS